MTVSPRQRVSVLVATMVLSVPFAFVAAGPASGQGGPSIQVDKSASPASLPAPGGTFTFTVTVTNTGSERVTITALNDDVYGDLRRQGTCPTAHLEVGGIYTCAFTGDFTGPANASQTDTVFVTASGFPSGDLVGDSDFATVFITGAYPPSLAVSATQPITEGTAPPLALTSDGSSDFPLGTVAILAGVVLLCAGGWLGERRRRKAAPETSSS